MVALRDHYDNAGNIDSYYSGVIGLGAGVVIDYDANTASYTLHSIGQVTVGPDDRTSRDGYWQTFEKTSGDFTDLVRIYGSSRAGKADGQIKLTYLNFGRWSNIQDSTGLHHDAYFLFGFPTGAAMPTNGTATYNTMLTADYVDSRENTQGQLDGTADFTVDFGAGTVGTNLSLLGRTYVGKGDLTYGDRFQGTFTSPDDLVFYGGEFVGSFFGPAAKEMGYSFWIRRTPLDPYAGASSRYPDMRIIGAVVGVKN